MAQRAQTVLHRAPTELEQPILGPANIAVIAALIGDSARAAMLDALMDGGMHPAGELARRAGVAASTASGHLSQLLAGGLIVCEVHGRERRYRLASAGIAEVLESLARIAPPIKVRSLRVADHGAAIRLARTCYDHLAGWVGVRLTEALIAQQVLSCGDSCYDLTATGEETMDSLGVDIAGARLRHRAFARPCIDWSERRPHLAGALGAALADTPLTRGWLRRRPHDRGLIVTDSGRIGLRKLGVDLP